MTASSNHDAAPAPSAVIIAGVYVKAGVSVSTVRTIPTAADLVTLPARADLPLVATLSPDGAAPPRRLATLVAPQPAPGQVAIRINGSIGDYRAGDEIWCDRIAPEGFADALNRDMLVPLPAGRLLFGRLIAHEAGRLHLLPPGPGTRTQTIDAPPWAAVAIRLIRRL
ncbi:XRE family transcriptional regulator [Sphingomonas solaris]|uniref:XRE family transcriptional regulator n=1 Tax=Alterirhizorhabdus solaris TaxID=2529389 RepID=A0A558R9Z8_9SPHN|nr:XRE family transcriptional regulator [Sphingomonas solaris]TVV76112.1 XRE family transcriptional regulator [Sphingomonas solaris]